MVSNFNRQIVPKKDGIYFVSYVDGDTSVYYEFYCKINLVFDETFYFSITEFIKGNEDKRFDDDIQMSWQQSDFNSAYLNEMTDIDLKELGRCVKCAKKLSFVRMAMVCPIHHFVGGL